MNACSHYDRASKGRVCPHPDALKDGYIKRFTGVDFTYDLLCTACAKQPDAIESTLALACPECFDKIEEEGDWYGILGQPQVRIADHSLRFEHETFVIPELRGTTFLNLQPIEGTAGTWLGCTPAGSLIEIDLVRRQARPIAQLKEDALDFDDSLIRTATEAWKKGPRVAVHVSRDGDLAAVANTYGSRGAVVDLGSGQITMTLNRGDYHVDVSTFPLALIEHDNRTLVVHGTDWNRLDVSDARTGVLLTQRKPTSYNRGQPRPPHHLDYFHGSLASSPGQEFVADNGWVWHPVGVIRTWSLRRWVEENVWESEDGPTKKSMIWRDYYWDGPLCWLDDRQLCVWGYGKDDEWLIPAVMIFDVHTGKMEKWFAGPKGSLVFDEHLFSFDPSEGMTVWDIQTGERLAHEPNFCPAGYHRNGRHFLTIKEDGAVQVSRIAGA